MYTVEIGTWENGAPKTVKSFEVSSKEEGVQALRNIGHSWDYNINYAGYLKEDGKTVARLDIFQNTYSVYCVDEKGDKISCG